MNIRSAKNKGRRLVVETKEALLHYAPELESGDIRVPTGSQGGEDLWLSPAAQKIYPISIECKNTEKSSPWSWIAQAQANCLDRKPVVVFSRNRAAPHVILSLEHFLELIRPKT
jgi:hypothetical protein